MRKFFVYYKLHIINPDLRYASEQEHSCYVTIEGKVNRHVIEAKISDNMWNFPHLFNIEVLSWSLEEE